MDDIFQGYIWQAAFEEVYGRLPEGYWLEVYGDELYIAFRLGNGEQEDIGPWYVLEHEGISPKTLAQIYIALAEYLRN